MWKPTRKLIPVLLALGATVPLLFAKAEPPGPMKQGAVSAVTKGASDFSTALYDVLRRSESTSNLVVSPLSISIVMAMLQVGAKGDTASAIRSSFRFPSEGNQLFRGYETILEELQSDKSVTLNLINKVYPMQGYKLNPTFSSIVRSYFGARPEQLNFSKPAEAAATINNFVVSTTNNRIKGIIAEADLGPRTRLAIVNGLYFKGTWKYEFPSERTRKMDFYIPGRDSPVQVDMMELTALEEHSIRCGDIPEVGARVVVLPYKGNSGLNMIVLVPKASTSLQQMEDKLKNMTWSDVFGKIYQRRMRLLLPKFKIETAIDLEKPLTELGTGIVFDSKLADFSNILENSTENIFVSKGLHKAVLEVNEEGSEAAASSVAVFSTRTEACLVAADSPFQVVVGKVTEVGEEVEVLPLIVSRVTNPQV